MIESVSFQALQPGKTLVFLGGVHGNEPCGTIALRETVERFRSGALSLKQGRVMFVPQCNPQAAKLKKRFIDRNLNRSLYRKDRKTAYEDHIDPILCDILDQADYVVDLHSYTVGHIPYVLIEGMTQANVDFAALMGIPDVLYGWADAYAQSGAALDPLENQGTTEYARLHGALAVTVECGQHDDPNSITVARNVIENALAGLGYIDAQSAHKDVAVYGITHAVFKNRSGDFVREWRNLDPIRKDDLIARYDDGETVLAPHDGYILLTKPWAAPGGEWFNTAIKQERT